MKLCQYSITDVDQQNIRLGTNESDTCSGMVDCDATESHTGD